MPRGRTAWADNGQAWSDMDVPYKQCPLTRTIAFVQTAAEGIWHR